MNSPKNITMQWKLLERKMLRHQWRLANHLTDHVLHLFVNLSIISFHSVVFVFATRLKSRDIKRALSKVKGCKNETDSMVNQKLNKLYLLIHRVDDYIKMTFKNKQQKNKTKKPWIWSSPHHSHVYIKGTWFSIVSVLFLKQTASFQRN